MSKKQIIKELALEVETARRDFESVVRQRDRAMGQVAAEKRYRDAQDAAKAEAAIQEKVDGIKAGLIPVEELRKHIRDTFEVRVNQDRSAHDFKLFFKQGETDRIALAIRDAILKEHAPKRLTDPIDNRCAGETWYLTGLPVL